MVKTLKRRIKIARETYSTKSHIDWFRDHPLQVILVICQQQLACEVHTILDKSDDVAKNLQEMENRKMDDMEKCVSLSLSDIKPAFRNVLRDLIIIYANFRNSIRNLIENGVIYS